MGEFFIDDVFIIRRVIIRYNEGKMIFVVDNYVFCLNYIKGMIFEFIDWRKVDCFVIVLMGINYERVYFDFLGSLLDGVLIGFMVFGFYFWGKVYFCRK